MQNDLLPPLKTYMASWLTCACVMVVLDVLWIGVIAASLYQAGIGHLMAPSPNVGVAVLFYAVYALGLVVFVVQPHYANPSRTLVPLRGALFGFCAYATYDLTNLATLKDWPYWLAALDMAWGSVISAAAALAGQQVWCRLSPKATP
jgi:uncharacterized membrane protein